MYAGYCLACHAHAKRGMVTTYAVQLAPLWGEHALYSMTRLSQVPVRKYMLKPCHVQ
jgi:hypothetical protein